MPSSVSIILALFTAILLKPMPSLQTVITIPLRRIESLDTYEDFHLNTSDWHIEDDHRLNKRTSISITSPASKLNEYVGTILLGPEPASKQDPPLQPFNVLFDTGSADLVIPLKGCKNCNKKNLYVPTNKQVRGNRGRPISIDYVGGTVTGYSYIDTVSINQPGNTKTITGLTGTKQTFLTGTDYPNLLATSNFDGILGMGFQSISKLQSLPVFQTLLKNPNNDLIPRFSFTPGNNPVLTLGGDDPKQDVSGINDIPVLDTGYWEIALQSVIANEKSVAAIPATKTAATAVIDTGYSGIVVPKADLISIFKPLEGSTLIQSTSDKKNFFYKITCGTSPDLHIKFQSDPTATYIISGRRLEEKVIDQPFCVTSDLIDGRSDQGKWILGGIFLSDVYSRFSIPSKDTPTVGFKLLNPLPVIPPAAAITTTVEGELQQLSIENPPNPSDPVLDPPTDTN